MPERKEAVDSQEKKNLSKAQRTFTSGFCNQPFFCLSLWLLPSGKTDWEKVQSAFKKYKAYELCSLQLSPCLLQVILPRRRKQKMKWLREWSVVCLSSSFVSRRLRSFQLKVPFHFCCVCATVANKQTGVDTAKDFDVGKITK